MRMRARFASAVIPVLLCLAMAAPAAGRPDRPGPKVGPAGRTTTILGSAWTANNEPIKQAHLRLRNVITGRVEAAATANDVGQFEFRSIESGSYVVELLSESGRVQVVGQVFSIAPGETVATFIRLGTRVPWYSGFFGNSIAAIAATAASEGITAIAPVARPVSATR